MMAGIIHELRCERCHLRAYHRTEAECIAALLEELHGTALRQTECASKMSTALMERDAARATLALLISDAEIAWHDYHNMSRHAGRREGCELEICRGLRRAVARATAPSEGA